MNRKDLSPGEPSHRARYPSRLAPLWTVAAMSLAVPAVAQTGVSPNAPDVVSYVGLGEDCCGEDPHPVHGIATDDGGYVLVGKSITARDGWGGFGLKVGPSLPTGTGIFLEPGEGDAFGWAVTIGSAGTRSALLNAAAGQDAVFLAGLLSSADGNADMYLAKHALADGRLIWEKRFPDPRPTGHGAIESIQLTADGGLIAGAVVNAAADGLEGFKSFGNPVGGQAHLFYLSPEQVSADTAPQAPTWQRTLDAYETVKAVREVTQGDPGFVLLVGAEDAPPGVVRTDRAGDPLWQQSYPGRFEPTDLTLNVRDGVHVGYTFTGHGGNEGRLDGQLTHIGLNGEQIWARSFGDPVGGVGPFAGLGAGNPQLIYDECWGIAGLSDGGTVVGCGTGIEGCELWERGSAIRTECEADPRKTWRGMVVRFDANGEKIWERIDSFFEAEAPEDPADSASEYVALTPNGGILSVVDQGFGIGLLVTASDDEPTPGGMGGEPAGTGGMPGGAGGMPEETGGVPAEMGGADDDVLPETGGEAGDTGGAPADMAGDDMEMDGAGGESAASEDDGGCAVSAGASTSSLPLWLGALLAVVGFSPLRRRRRPWAASSPRVDD